MQSNGTSSSEPLHGFSPECLPVVFFSNFIDQTWSRCRAQPAEPDSGQFTSMS